MVTRNLQDLETLLVGHLDRTAIWTLCHYPEHPETDARVKVASEIARRWNLPVWLFGSSSARYPLPVEQHFRQKFIEQGVPEENIFVSTDFGILESLDTVQEMFNIARTAEAKGVKQVVCISNPLQLLQVHGLMRKAKVKWIYVPSTQTDWRWWYLSARLFLIPVAFAGMGMKFGPLKFVRHARAAWKNCPF